MDVAEFVTEMKKLTAALDRHSKALENIGKPGAASTSTKTTDKPETTKKDESKHPSDDQIRKAFGDYMNKGDDDEKETRKGHVLAIFGQYDVKRATDIPPEKRMESVGYLKQLMKGETPEFMAGEGGEGGDDLLG